MKIAKVLEMDVGQTGLSVEGKVKWAGQAPKFLSGTSATGKDYAFWTQFIVVEDETGDIGVSVGVAEGQKIVAGQPIRIEKARLKEWQGKKSLERAHIAQLSAPQAPPTDPKSTKSAQAVQNYPPSTADAIKSRGVALSYCIGKEYMDLAFITSDEKEGVYGLALEIAGFMLTGKIPGFKEKYNIPKDDGEDDGSGPPPNEEECPI